MEAIPRCFRRAFEELHCQVLLLVAWDCGKSSPGPSQTGERVVDHGSSPEHTPVNGKKKTVGGGTTRSQRKKTRQIGNHFPKVSG